MAISFNTGTSADSGGSQTTSQAITVPAGVLASDVVLILAQQVPVTSTPSTFTISSTGTQPVSAGSPVTGTEPLPAAVTGQVFYFVASATDAGKVVTITASATGFWAVGLVAYTGASNTAPIDVIAGAFGGANSGTVTCPTVKTRTSSDWAVFLGGGAGENSSALTPPTGSTTRVSDVSSSQIDAVISDSNASVGAAGTSIGGGTFTSPTSTNSILTAFTLGLAPPVGSVQPPSTFPTPRRKPSRAVVNFTPVRTTNTITALGPAGTVQPLATFPTPRRKPARAVSRSIAGQAFVAVAAPRQEYQTAPRRKPSRAVVQFTPVVTFNTGHGPAGTVQPLATVPVPRRRPARAATGFTPVRTTNAAAVTPSSGTVQPLATFPTPRRKPARGVTGFTPVKTFNTGHGPAGTVQPTAVPATAPRRRPARTVTGFTPVTTTNSTQPVVMPVPPPLPGGGRSMLARAMRWADL